MNENAEGPDSYHSRAKEDEAFVSRLEQREWQNAWTRRMEQTAPVD